MGKTENKDMAMETRQITDTEPVNRIVQYKNTSKYNYKGNSEATVTAQSLKGKCFRCGNNDHKANTCGAKNSICNKCQKIGHLARVCLQRNIRTNQLLNGPITNTNEEHIADINIINSEYSEKYTITVEIESKFVKMEFDTGATLSTMSLQQYKNLQIDKKIYKTDIKLKTYTGEIIKPVGVTYVKCAYKFQTFFGKLYIIKENVDAIFGRSWMKEVDIQFADIKTIQRIDRQYKLEKLFEEFSSIFKTEIGKIPNYSAHFNLKDNVEPIYVKPRRVPYALKAKIDTELDRLCTLGIITKVDNSEWGTPIVPVIKSNGNIRLCADYKITLNRVIKDDPYPIPIIEDIFSEMNGGEWFCTLDINQAYLNMEVDEETARLQTLSTHKGSYKVNKLMFGVKVAPGLWQKFMDKMLQGMDGTKCFFDDIIIQGSTEDQLYNRLRQVLQKLKENNLRINKDKCNFFSKSITYLGHTIDKHGLHKNREKITAITNTQHPTNINELRIFLGMVNYYNKFIQNLASITNPLNELLQKGKKFNWSKRCEMSFKRIKEEIASDKVLAHFDPSKVLVLATDASPVGLGAVLSHRLPDGSDQPIAFASRTLTNAEKKYSQIDKEATAIFWGLNKFFQYCYGRKFTLITDHKPLTTIFHPHRTLPAMSTMRMFHYAHFLSGFNYDIEYRTSTQNSNADYLSRFPVEQANDKLLDQSCMYQLQQIYTLDLCLETITKETETDPELKQILQALQTGRSVKQYGYNDNELTLQDNCIFKGTRLIIPQNLRERVLEELHMGHIGIVKMKLLARSYVYWKNMDAHIENKVKSCRICRLEQNEPRKETLHHWEQPTAPWQRIHIDFAGPVDGFQFFILIDAYSKWVEVIPTKRITSSWCIQTLREIFCNFGCPYILVSDNGRQFVSQEIEEFLKEQGVTHRTIAPFHPSTNGQAERYVQTVKKSLRKLKDTKGSIKEKLLVIKTHLRRTPNSTGLNSYQLMFARNIRTELHVMFGQNSNREYPSTSPQSPIKREFHIEQRIQARSYTHPGKRWEFGRIKRRLGKLHYEVSIDGGGVWRRHVDQLLPADQVTPEST